MGWQDRVRDGAYTSPSGTRMVFTYEDVSKQVEKRTTGFEFPQVNGTLVQDLGHSGRKFPLKIIFWGDDYDLDADEFETLLLETGEGRLEHPIYGVVNVVPFGTITRSDRLTTAGNQTEITVVFWQTLGVSYPSGSGDPASGIFSAVNEYNLASAAQAAVEFDTSSVIESTTAINEFQSLLDQSKSALQNLVDFGDDALAAIGSVATVAASVRLAIATARQQVANVRQQFENAYASITAGLESSDALSVSGASTTSEGEISLVSQTAIFLQTPGKAGVSSLSSALTSPTASSSSTTSELIRQQGFRVGGGVAEKIATYSALIDQIVTLSPVVETAGSDSRNSNRFHSRDVFASTLVTGVILSVVNSTFETKPEAIEAAEQVLTLFSTVQTWRDNNYASLEQVDTGQAYQQLQEAVALTAGFLVEISFSLRQERTIILDRKRTIVDLAAELYGSVDDQLNFLINSNNLSGSEIIELPKGREIKYYA